MKTFFFKPLIKINKCRTIKPLKTIGFYQRVAAFAVLKAATLRHRIEGAHAGTERKEGTTKMAEQAHCSICHE